MYRIGRYNSDDRMCDLVCDRYPVLSQIMSVGEVPKKEDGDTPDVEEPEKPDTDNPEVEKPETENPEAEKPETPEGEES